MRSLLTLGLGLVTLTALGCKPEPPLETPEPDPVPDAAADEGEGQGHYELRYGEQTILVHADPALSGEVERLFLLFEDLRAESITLSADTRLPIGWTTLSFRADGPRLIVEEPDYDDNPESRTRPDISVSLAILARQRAVLQQVGVPGEAMNFDQHVLTIRGVLEREEVMLIRVQSPGGRMTGWRLTPAEGLAEADEIDSLPVYEILAARPELLDAMLLPPGYLVLYSGAQLTTIVNEANEVVWDWSRDGDLPRDRASELGSALGDQELIPRPRPQPLLEPLD